MCSKYAEENLSSSQKNSNMLLKTKIQPDSVNNLQKACKNQGILDQSTVVESKYWIISKISSAV